MCFARAVPKCVGLTKQNRRITLPQHHAQYGLYWFTTCDSKEEICGYKTWQIVLIGFIDSCTRIKEKFLVWWLACFFLSIWTSRYALSQSPEFEKSGQDFNHFWVLSLKLQFPLRPRKPIVTASGTFTHIKRNKLEWMREGTHSQRCCWQLFVCVRVDPLWAFTTGERRNNFSTIIFNSSQICVLH